MRKAEILLIEDNPGDVILTKKAFESSEIEDNITVAENGEEALKMLQAEKYQPDLILLDLNLPKIDGYEVLNSLKNDSKLKQIPVIIMTSSEEHSDIAKSYDNHANCYIVKPVDSEQLSLIAEKIENFWFTTAKLPNLHS
mgnify:CR=1 FL=1